MLAISAATNSNIKASSRTIVAALKALLTQGPVVQIDETPVQVMGEPGRANTQQSFMWAFRGGPIGKPVRGFESAPSRAAEVPRRVLSPPRAEAPRPFYGRST